MDQNESPECSVDLHALGESDKHVDAEQAPVLGDDHQRVPGPNDAGRCERRRLL